MSVHVPRLAQVIENSAISTRPSTRVQFERMVVEERALRPGMSSERESGAPWWARRCSTRVEPSD